MNHQKDSQSNSQKDTYSLATLAGVQGFAFGSYSKTNKLITALYMVTDIMDKDEPLRGKLRNLGAGIISDTHSAHTVSLSDKGQILAIERKIIETLSFLEIALAVDLISEMNCNILKKEFSVLKESIDEFKSNMVSLKDNPVWLEEFLLNTEEEATSFSNVQNTPLKDQKDIKKVSASIGHHGPTRIGLQSGSTLMKALREVKVPEKISTNIGHPLHEAHALHAGFDVLKKQRRDEVIKIIREKTVATIKDIKDSATGVLVSCGEKTLQRELVSMVADGVLKKSGEKRWSRYSIKN